MAIVAHLVTRVKQGDNTKRDGITAMIVAIDNAVDTTNALVQARAVTVANAAGWALPAGYFDTNILLSTYDAAGDCSIFTDRIYHAIS